jgi:Putative beta-barrel porin-2, OmpL-like. bbp2
MEGIVSSKSFRAVTVGFVATGAIVWSGTATGQTEMAEPPPPPQPSALETPAPNPPAAPAVAAPTPAAAPTTESKAADPFAFADFGWINGTSRQTEFPLDGKVLSPSFTIESGYAYEFSNPVDHTVVGSTAIGRHNELQIVHLGVGGDFHWKGARGRIMTQLGMYSTMTPRNDASPGRGQWDLADAYRYITEGYGGYHLDILNGINIDAGIFLSYVGLCSYYNYENWISQASYVSSNTPWFFNGVRIQIFATDKLKIEPWLINGWQSYGEFNNLPGFGLQILYRPTGWVSITLNNYYGKDTLGLSARNRYHSDDSLVLKYFEAPNSFVNRGAISLTVDAGCEDGGGVSCGGKTDAPAQYFVGAMLYNRLWFAHDLFGFTAGGGVMSNPGRYLVLMPPINGATAFTGTPYFSYNKGDQFKAWDMTFTLDWMPIQFFTLRAEYTHRHASVPYFAGHGGVTPPGGNNGDPVDPVTGWAPDLRKDEDRLGFSLFVRI